MGVTKAKAPATPAVAEETPAKAAAKARDDAQRAIAANAKACEEKVAAALAEHGCKFLIVQEWVEPVPGLRVLSPTGVRIVPR